MPKNSNDLKGDQKTRYTAIGTLVGAASQALIDFNNAVDGPNSIQHPSARVMTGAVNSAQAAEQATAASGKNRNQPLSESGGIPNQ